MAVDWPRLDNAADSNSPNCSHMEESLKTIDSFGKSKTLKYSKMKIAKVTGQCNLFGQLLIISEDNNLSV